MKKLSFNEGNLVLNETTDEKKLYSFIKHYNLNNEPDYMKRFDVDGPTVNVQKIITVVYKNRVENFRKKTQFHIDDIDADNFVLKSSNTKMALKFIEKLIGQGCKPIAFTSHNDFDIEFVMVKTKKKKIKRVEKIKEENGVFTLEESIEKLVTSYGVYRNQVTILLTNIKKQLNQSKDKETLKKIKELIVLMKDVENLLK